MTDSPRSTENVGAVLALDVGTKMGFALRLSDNSITSGAKDFETGRHVGIGLKFLLVRNWLTRLYKEHSFSLVAYEKVTFRNLSNTKNGVLSLQMFGAYEAIITSWCEARQIPYFGMNVSQVRSFAFGDGSLPKNTEAKIQRNKRALKSGRKPYEGLTAEDHVRKLGFDPQTPDESDALAVLIAAEKIRQTQQSITDEGS